LNRSIIRNRVKTTAKRILAASLVSTAAITPATALAQGTMSPKARSEVILHRLFRPEMEAVTTMGNGSTNVLLLRRFGFRMGKTVKKNNLTIHFHQTGRRRYYMSVTVKTNGSTVTSGTPFRITIVPVH
jgi:hypothetical protein